MHAAAHAATAPAATTALPANDKQLLTATEPGGRVGRRQRHSSRYRPDVPPIWCRSVDRGCERDRRLPLRVWGRARVVRRQRLRLLRLGQLRARRRRAAGRSRDIRRTRELGRPRSGPLHHGVRRRRHTYMYVDGILFDTAGRRGDIRLALAGRADGQRRLRRAPPPGIYAQDHHARARPRRRGRDGPGRRTARRLARLALDGEAARRRRRLDGARGGLGRVDRRRLVVLFLLWRYVFSAKARAKRQKPPDTEPVWRAPSCAIKVGECRAPSSPSGWQRSVHDHADRRRDLAQLRQLRRRRLAEPDLVGAGAALRSDGGRRALAMTVCAGACPWQARSPRRRVGGGENGRAGRRTSKYPRAQKPSLTVRCTTGLPLRIAGEAVQQGTGLGRHDGLARRRGRACSSISRRRRRRTLLLRRSRRAEALESHRSSSLHCG